MARDTDDKNSERNINVYCQQVLNFPCCFPLDILPLEDIFFNGQKLVSLMEMVNIIQST